MESMRARTGSCGSFLVRLDISGRTGSSLPDSQELLQVRLARSPQHLPDTLAFPVIFHVGIPATDQFIAQVHQIGIQDIGLAIVPDRLNPAFLVTIPHLAP